MKFKIYLRFLVTQVRVTKAEKTVDKKLLQGKEGHLYPAAENINW